MSSPLLDVQHVTKRFGGFHALTDVSLQVHGGERVGLIGPNGSGKTTLINCIAGLLQTDGGRIRFRGTDITTRPAHQRTRLGIARTFQIPKPFTSMTAPHSLYKDPQSFISGGCSAIWVDGMFRPCSAGAMRSPTRRNLERGGPHARATGATGPGGPGEQ